MAIGREPGDVVACLVFDSTTLAVEPGSYGADVASLVVDSPTSVRVTLTNPGDADRLSILASADGDTASATAVVVEPTGAPNEWRVSWAAVGGGGGGVTSVGAVSPLTSSGGTTPVLALSGSGPSGNVLTWNGSAWVSLPPAAAFGSKVLLCVEGGAYLTIQDAINAAADWDVILVGPKSAGGSWGPAAFSAGKRLSVVGLGAKETTQIKVDSITFDATGGANINVNTVFVRGLFINSSFTALAPGVNFFGTSPGRLRLQECFLFNSNAAGGTGVVSNNSGAGSSLYLDNCTIQSGFSTGIGVDHVQGYTRIKGDSEVSRFQYALQCAGVAPASTVEISDTILDNTGSTGNTSEVVRITGGLVTCGYSTIKNTNANASGVNLTAAGAVFGMGDATFAIGAGSGYCVRGVGSSVFLYGSVTYSNSAAAAYNVKVQTAVTSLPVTQSFTPSV
jgi:hypothetical protein